MTGTDQIANKIVIVGGGITGYSSVSTGRANSRPAPWSSAGARWHVADWGPWGAAETAVKVFAILTAILAAFPDGAARVPATNQTTYWILVAITASYVLSIFDRLKDRELTAMLFVVANLAGHGAILYTMGADAWPATPVRAFVGLMLLGDLIKIGFFVCTRATVRSAPRWVPIALTTTLAALYLVALVNA